jgi:hypothetical protein
MYVQACIERDRSQTVPDRSQTVTAGTREQVSAAADELTGPGEPAARGRLVAGLRELSDVLLAHLAYEEDNVSATLAAMTSWPAW